MLQINLFTKTMTKHRFLLASIVASVTIGAPAQTFLHDGICYRADGTELTLLSLHPINSQKPSPENGTLPDTYTGDVVIPESIEYNGKTYTVTTIEMGAFTDAEITSFSFASTVRLTGKSVFEECRQLASVTFSTGLKEIPIKMFYNCTALTELTVPGTVEKVGNSAFTGCSSLKKITFEEGPEPLVLDARFKSDSKWAEPSGLTEIVLRHKLGRYRGEYPLAFRGDSILEKVTVGGNVDSIPEEYFSSCRNLTSVDFEGTALKAIGRAAFSETGFTDLTVPRGVTEIPEEMLYHSEIRRVNIQGPVTTIGPRAFKKTKLNTVNFPQTLQRICDEAFNQTFIDFDIALPEGVDSIGNMAFASSFITSLKIPEATTKLGRSITGKCNQLKSLTVAPGNPAYRTVTDGILETRDGKTLVQVAAASEFSTISGDYTKVAWGALWWCYYVKKLDLPCCTEYEDYALMASGVEEVTLRGKLGKGILKDCMWLKKLRVESATIPEELAIYCRWLEDVEFSDSVTVIGREAFLGTESLKKVSLGSNITMLGDWCFVRSGLRNIEMTAAAAPLVGYETFGTNEELTVTVPAELLNVYKNADGWKNYDIVGDETLEAPHERQNLPAGIYYAGTDGMLHCVYSDGQSDVYDLGGIPHTFQLQPYNNRLYGTSAGGNIGYSANHESNADGKLFFFTKIGERNFHSVIRDYSRGDAKGEHDGFYDPHGIAVFADTLYVFDRGLSIRKVAGSASSDGILYNPWMRPQWTGYYSSSWSYGNVWSGLEIEPAVDEQGNDAPVYWLGVKYNGYGIFPFREKDIYPGKNGWSDNLPMPDLKPLLTSQMQISAFCFDFPNDHLYVCAGMYSPSFAIYRFELSKIRSSISVTLQDGQLIDDSPIETYFPNTEVINITQFAKDADGEYLYWCYRAGEGADPRNPMHTTGIKRLKLGQAKPAVEMVAPGAAGYGLAVIDYDGSVKPGSGVENVLAVPAELMVFRNGAVTALEDARIAIYSTSGRLMADVDMVEGQSLSTDGLPSGVYIVVARNGANSRSLKIAI